MYIYTISTCTNKYIYLYINVEYIYIHTSRRECECLYTHRYFWKKGWQREFLTGISLDCPWAKTEPSNPHPGAALHPTTQRSFLL